MTFLAALFWIWVAGNVLGTVFVLWLCWDEIACRCRRAFGALFHKEDAANSPTRQL